jgi:hypothetical protein
MSRFAAFVVCVCVLAGRSADDKGKDRPSMLEWAKKSQARVAYGIYIKGKRVGWSVDEIKLAKRDGKDVLVATSESYMVTLFDGEKSTKADKSTYTYSLEGDGPMLHADVFKEDDGKAITRVGALVGKKFEITTTQGGRKSKRAVTVPKDTLAHQREFEDWLGAERKAGDRREKWGVTWEEADIDQKETYTIKGSKETVLAGVKTRLLTVEVESDGAKMPAEVFPDGKVYTAEVGGLLMLKMEPEKVAKALDGKLVDLMSAASVVLEKDLGLFGREVDSLKLELTDVGDFKMPESHRQVVTAGKGSVTVELKRDFKVEEGAALTKEQEKRWTRSTPRIQCDEKAIREKAEEIVGDEKDAQKRARKLARWVFRTLKKSYSDNADTALEVLDHKAGDCTEHSLLYVALCRSLGIPAREVGGLAYVRASKPLLGWHAWAEIHDGHQWVSVDPTWDQFFVDGTHLKLSEGSRDSAWSNLAGKVQVKVVEFKRRGK